MEEKVIWIPKERVAVLIGAAGRDKRAIEKQGKIKLAISDEGDVTIYSKDIFANWQAQKVVEAIGRGFAPATARKLFDSEYFLELIYMQDFAGKSKKRQQIIKGRIIGTSGSIREEIEKAADVSISIYGKTVGVIGKHEDVLLAKQAVESILSGARQGTAIGFLMRSKKDSILRAHPQI